MMEETRRRYEEQIESLTQRLNERLNEESANLARRSQLEFRALAEDILAGNKEALNRENRRQLSEMLNPLNDNIDKFKQAVEHYYLEDNRDKGALTRQLEELMSANRRIGEETRRLSNALSTNTRAQGQWGETVLEKMLNNAGMIKGVNYLTQSQKDENGMLLDEDDRRQKPDLILLLPDDHKVIIDAKVSITHYLRYIEAENEPAAESALKKHTESVKKHVDELARKQYHKNVAGAMEHTLMFIPNDAAYIAAINNDPDLWDYAYRNNVVIVSGTHLLSVLQLIRQFWRVDSQDKNAAEIARLGGVVFDKLVAFINDFNDVKRHLDATSKAYEKCVTHIEHSTVGLKARAARLKDLGSKASKRLN